MKGLKITTNNDMSVVTIENPTWKGLGKEVGGMFEHVRPRGLKLFGDKYCMIVNESGRLLGLPQNKLGTILYNYGVAYDLFWEPIVGDILILAEGLVNGEPDIVGLDDEELMELSSRFEVDFDFLKEV